MHVIYTYIQTDIYPIPIYLSDVFSKRGMMAKDIYAKLQNKTQLSCHQFIFS